MRPAFAVYDATDFICAHIDHSAQLPLCPSSRSVHYANKADLSFSNNRSFHFRASTPAQSTLSQSVMSVLSVRPRKKMVWVAARFIVTGMANAFTFRNWSFRKKIRKAMCAPKLSFPFTPTIPSFFNLSQPWPALGFSSLGDLIPKAFYRCSSFVGPFFQSAFSAPLDALLVSFRNGCTLANTLTKGKDFSW